MVLCAFPLQVLISITRCFATVHTPRNRLYKVFKKKKKSPLPHTQTNSLFFLMASLPTQVKSQHKAPLKNQHSIAQTGT